MLQAFASPRFAVGLSLLVAALGCDGTSTSAPSPTGMSRSQVAASSLNQGSADVEVVINHAPQVTSVQSSAGSVASGASVVLEVVASDADGDALSFVWKSTCPGAFDRTDLAQVTFTAGALAAATSCSFVVDVFDGHGGAATGTIVLSAVPPKIDVAPQMGIVYQSTADAAGGEVVILHATATDPEGEALTWTWKSDDGAFSNQTDDASGSDVHWTAPATPGAISKITATAMDPEGASAAFVFTVKVAS